MPWRLHYEWLHTYFGSYKIINGSNIEIYCFSVVNYIKVRIVHNKIIIKKFQIPKNYRNTFLVEKSRKINFKEKSYFIYRNICDVSV